MASSLLDIFYSLTNCMACFPSSPNLKINNRSFKILRLLGEVQMQSERWNHRLTTSQGGFSYVYLVEDNQHNLYALKKIRCPFGQESVSLALKEVEAYALFSSPNIITAVDHAVVSDRGEEGSKTVYILLPYYRRGNLQDAINANLVNGTKFPERRLMELFLGVCKGLKAMHQYRVPRGGAGEQNRKKARRLRDEGAAADRAARAEAGDDDAHEESQPLVEDEVTASQAGVEPGGVRAYAHRDMKPGNVMIEDDGLTPIIMDLGSLQPAPTPITSRSQALAVQDQAAEHSTMSYRAPELFDVKTGSTIDTKVDIWSLGCTLYACLVGKSPFEARSEETGGSLSLCVLGGDWRFPDEGVTQGKKKQGEVIREGANGQPKEEGISEPVKDVVRRCLKVEPSERPDIDELIQLIEDVIAQFPEDGGSS